jgi:type IV secretory pathway VirB3-like protein
VAEAGLAATALMSGTTRAAAVRAAPMRVTAFLLLMTILYLLLVS